MISIEEQRAAIDAEFYKRIQRLNTLRAEPSKWDALKVYYKDHPADFINDWGVTYDPRNVEVGLPAAVPFTLWAKQIEFIAWLKARWNGREDGITEKSRDAGASWLCCGFAVWMWDFYAGSVVGFGSRKEEYVDDSKDPKSIFWKLRSFIDYLPSELRPKHTATYMQIVNDDNGASLVGEAGDNIGRGARTSIYFKDESAFLERAELIDRALSQTSNCKIDVSTANGMDNPFARRRHSGKVPVFTFNWRDDPRKDYAWYAAQVAKLDNPVTVAQEIDIDYNASTTDSYISGDLVSDAQGNGPADVVAHGAWIVGVDAAHFGDDKSVITPRKGRLQLPATKRAKLSGPELAGQVVAVCEDLPGEVFAIVIELDGPGVSAFDQLKLHPKYGPKTVGIHTGAALSDGKHYNVKALMWANMKAWYKDTPVSVPPDSDLKTQVSAMRYSYKDGLLLMEKKAEYKKRVGRSPDDADSAVLTHIPVTLLPQPAQSFDIPTVVTAYNRRK